MPQPTDALQRILDLEPAGHDAFRGTSPQTGWQRVFGGLVVAQALVAASRTVEAARRPHSCHAYFLHPGDPQVPLAYEVERLRDGRGFTTRRVLAHQHGRPIFALTASFQVPERGLEHAPAMPAVPDPDALPGEGELAGLIEGAPETVRTYWRRERPIELRPVEPGRWLARREDAGPQYIWMRAVGRLPDDPVLHEAALAYASDLTLLDTSLVPHGRGVFDADMQAASLDHALWFHGPLRADEWLLYAQDTPFAGGARGFSRGQVWTRDGRLVASVAQEGLIRVRA